MSRFELKDSDYSFNASLDPFMVLKKMGFTENSIYQEGDIVRVHCPIHKDLVRKSLIIDVAEKTFKCQYANCEAHSGGLLIELVALYYDCDVREVSKALFGQEDKASDLLFRGEMFINQGRHNDALPYLEQACDLDPRNEITRCKLAALYLELNRKDDAYREYLQAAESYAVRGELDKTLSIYNILIMLQPGAVKARKELAFLFSRMGRPDAAADQLKWVVDFYMKYNQVKGAQEACEQILELDPTNAMGHILYAKLLNAAGKRVPAMQSYETGAKRLLEMEDFSFATAVLEEAVSLAPGNPRLKEMLGEAKAKRDASRSPLTESAKREMAQGEEQAFIDWLNEVDTKLALGEEPDAETLQRTVSRLTPIPVRGKSGTTPVPVSASKPEPVEDIPLFNEMQEAVGGGTAEPRQNDTTEITSDDRRVAMCLSDMKELDNNQIEAMRQQLISMFTDVRKTYEDGHLSEWEMRTIKEFYKAFCVAVDVHRRSHPAKAGKA